MIHYHGGPVTPTDAAVKVWAGRHSCVSFAHPQQAALAFEVCQTVILDNGAYSAWTSGAAFDFDGYAAWVRTYLRHPAFDWCLIPDVIDGSENDNMHGRRHTPALARAHTLGLASSAVMCLLSGVLRSAVVMPCAAHALACLGS